MNFLTTNNSEFLVRESRWGNYILGSLMILVFLISWWMGDYGWGMEMNIIVMFLIPAGFLFMRGRKNATLIRINSNGFFYRERLVTDWQHFADIKLCEEERGWRIDDHFYLMVRYTKPGTDDLFGRKIKMSNTQDKADEEIILAVKRIYNEWIDSNTVITKLHDTI